MNTKMNKLALAMGALVMAGGAWAADSGSTAMGTSATIVDECSVGNIAPLAFSDLVMLNAGAQSATASASTGGTFDAICTNNIANTPKLKFSSANALTTSSFRLVGTDTSTYIVYTLKQTGTGATAITHGTEAAFPGFSADGKVKKLAIAGSIAASDKAEKKVQVYSDTITILSSYNL